MIYKDINIEPHDIKCVIPHNKRVLLRPLRVYADLASNLKDSSLQFFICVDNVEDADMTRFKFEHIMHLKKMPNPEDRVADFEWRDDNNLPDFDKLDRLIEKRKTRQERQAEIKEDMYWIEQFEKHGLECEFLKDALKKKIQGV